MKQIVCDRCHVAVIDGIIAQFWDGQASRKAGSTMVKKADLCRACYKDILKI